MRKSVLSAIAFSILVAVAACESQKLSAPRDGESDGLHQVPSLPTSNATLSCSYTPSGNISIAIGNTQTFGPSNLTDCIGAYGVISPADHRLGFNVDTTCAVTQRQEGGPAHLFKVHRCSAGGGTFKIYTNSAKTTLLQTIEIDLIP